MQEISNNVLEYLNFMKNKIMRYKNYFYRYTLRYKIILTIDTNLIATLNLKLTIHHYARKQILSEIQSICFIKYLKILQKKCISNKKNQNLHKITHEQTKLWRIERKIEQINK